MSLSVNMSDYEYHYEVFDCGTVKTELIFLYLNFINIYLQLCVITAWSVYM